MVANHFRWDFIGLSTDTKPTADNPRVADGSTYYESNTSKVYVWYKDRWYEKTATGGSYELPTASASTLGGVKVGEGLSIDAGGVLSASGYELPAASASTLGGVKVGEGLSIDAGGVLSASGGGGGIVTLTEADYDFPNNNPEYVAIWRLPAGIYQCTGIQFATANDQTNYDLVPATFIVNKTNPEEGTGAYQATIYEFSNSANAMQITVVNPQSSIDGASAGRYTFTLE